MSAFSELKFQDGKDHTMRLLLTRLWFTEKVTLGYLTIQGNDSWKCCTLEDRLRLDGTKVPGKTAISEGTYGIVLSESPTLRYVCPLLIAVPNFKGVRIHVGNTETDTEGCILVGKEVDHEKMMILYSKAAFNELMDLLKRSPTPIEITIKNELA